MPVSRGFPPVHGAPHFPIPPSIPNHASLPACGLSPQGQPEPPTCFAPISGCPSLRAPPCCLPLGGAGQQGEVSALPCWPCLRSLVTAGEIHEIQTARKINLSFIFMMVMQQPSAAAFALQLHPSIAARFPLPTPRRCSLSIAHGALGLILASSAPHQGPTLHPSEPPSTSQAAAAMAVCRYQAGTGCGHTQRGLPG